MNNVSDLLNHHHHHTVDPIGSLKDMRIPQMHKKHFSMILLNALFTVADYLDDNMLLENSTRTDSDFKLFIMLIKNTSLVKNELTSQFSKEMNMFTRINMLNMSMATISNVIQFNELNTPMRIPIKITSELNKYKTVDDLRLIEMDLKHRVKMKLTNDHHSEMYPFRLPENMWIDGTENSLFFFMYFYTELTRNSSRMILKQPFEIYLRKLKCFIYSYMLMNISDLYSSVVQGTPNNMNQINRLASSGNIGKNLQNKVELSKKIYQYYKAFGYISPFCIINSYHNLYKLPSIYEENNLILTEDLRDLLIAVIFLSLF